MGKFRSNQMITMGFLAINDMKPNMNHPYSHPTIIVTPLPCQIWTIGMSTYH